MRVDSKPDTASQDGGADAMDLVSGGHLVARALRNEGVDTIFTLCGGHISDIYDGCLDEKIRIIDVRHEQVAAHAADGYARMTGFLGCAVVTAGPGTTNAVTGVANAFRAESPMLLIGGQAAHQPLAERAGPGGPGGGVPDVHRHQRCSFGNGSNRAAANTSSISTITVAFAADIWMTPQCK